MKKASILESKMLQGSRDKSKILAAMNDPINMELKQQLAEYVDIPSVEEDEESEDGKGSKVHRKDKAEDSGKGPHDGKPGKAAKPKATKNAGSHRPKPASFEDASDEAGEPDGEKSSDDRGESGSVDSSVTAPGSKVMASSVTADEVAAAVNEIPGTFNMVDDTKGVTHAVLKGGSDNEVWVYFDDDTDINKVLEHANRMLSDAGYYFLAFDRVSRSDNAIVYAINWVSSYFNPAVA